MFVEEYTTVDEENLISDLYVCYLNKPIRVYTNASRRNSFSSQTVWGLGA